MPMQALLGASIGRLIALVSCTCRGCLGTLDVRSSGPQPGLTTLGPVLDGFAAALIYVQVELHVPRRDLRDWPRNRQQEDSPTEARL